MLRPKGSEFPVWKAEPSKPLDEGSDFEAFSVSFWELVLMWAETSGSVQVQGLSKIKAPADSVSGEGPLPGL